MFCLKDFRMENLNSKISSANRFSKEPIISIIVPALNEEKHLAECLESLIHQKGNIPYEIIVVDNGSEDKTPQIAQNKNVKLVIEPIQGLTQARQAGFNASKGKIIAYIDADSIAPDDWILSIQETFRQYPDAVGLCGLYRFVLKSKVHRALFWFYFNLVEKMITKFLGGQRFAGTNFAVCRSSLEKIGGFNLKVVFYGEDVDLATRLKKIGKIYPFNSIVVSSGRRFDEKGILIPGFIYLFNYLWLLLFKKPIFNFYDKPENNAETQKETNSVSPSLAEKET